MCGFAVAIDWPQADATVARLIDGILHRGDITDPLFSPLPNIAMCTRRLRIVDAEHGTQPQISFYGRLAVSFNGEIYNHAALRREMEDLGVGFRTQSDTEVLANALQIWGPRALERLNGMYAFVAVDLTNGEFLAARDPFGVKPLYVMQAGKGFLFCSEMRPLLNTVPEGDVMLLPPGFALGSKQMCAFQVADFPAYRCAGRELAESARRHPARSGAHAAAARPAGGDIVFRRHRLDACRALRARIPPRGAGLFRRR